MERVAGRNIQIVTAISEKDKSHVYLAMDEDHKPVIYKKLMGEDKSWLYRRIQMLSSSFFPKIEVVEYEGGVTFVLEEYIEGTGLDMLLQSEMDTADGISYMEQLLRAMMVLHSQNPPIIYRDVKPENIIIKPDGGLVLVDFDATREYFAGERNRDTRMLGTRGYASPEQFGFAQTDVRSDLYSVGIVFRQIVDRMELSSHLKKEIGKLVDKATMFDPAQRYQTAEQMFEALCKIKRKQERGSCRSILFGWVCLLSVVVFLVIFIGLSMRKYDRNNPFDERQLFSGHIVPEAFHYVPMEDVWEQTVRQVKREAPELLEIPIDSENADGVLQDGRESSLGGDLPCVRYFKAYPQALVMYCHEFEGKMINEIHLVRYSKGGEQKLEKFVLGNASYCTIRDGNLCVSAEILEQLEPGLYEMSILVKGDWNWNCCLIVHGEEEKVDNFVVHAEEALQVYSKTRENDIQFHLLNSPYSLKTVICNGELVSDEEYVMFLDERGIVLSGNFFETRADEQVLDFIFLMQNDRKAYGRVLIVP